MFCIHFEIGKVEGENETKKTENGKVQENLILEKYVGYIGLNEETWKSEKISIENSNINTYKHTII